MILLLSIPIIEDWNQFPLLRNDKIPYSSVKVHSNFPIYGIADMVKNYSPTRGFAACGGIMFHHACYANMGKFECTSPDS